MSNADNNEKDGKTPSPGDADYSNYGSRFARDEEGRRVDGDHRDLGTPPKEPKATPAVKKSDASSR